MRSNKDMKQKIVGSRLKVWVVDRRAEGLYQNLRGPTYFLAIIIFSLWGRGLGAA